MRTLLARLRAAVSAPRVVCPVCRERHRDLPTHTDWDHAGDEYPR